MPKNFQELMQLDEQQLKVTVEELKRELLSLRLSCAAGQTKDVSQFKKLRKDVARTLTCLRQKA